MAKINAFFKMLHEHGGSDLHLSAGAPPMLRLRGDLQRIKYKPFSDEDLKKLLFEITPQAKIKEFEETGDVDFAYEAPGLARYRVNFFRQHRGVGAVFREIPQHVLTTEQLGLPPQLAEMAMLEKGIVLVTGPTGSGKSTTLAAMLDHANKKRRDHILTIEDPIEFVHPSQGCLINQREVGRHTGSFKAALRGALREDPDIILVGEMRDYETIALALEAAETGHLVLSTLHTVSAVKTIDRIIEVFPEDMQSQVRSSFADSFKAVISQTLMKRADGSGRVAAVEILRGTPAVRNLIRKGENHQIPSVMQTNKHLGMQPLDDHIRELLEQGAIDRATARHHALDRSKFEDPQEP
ncbi:twitching motility protein PilT [Paucidesulfovibrio gracilis DSM 16080]|uniref:Twitching motility protein PilT n=1 Tax=Paucidesulfovibrio gracilis DSM 16080 TaxID=1121449 RepID=A0A1T4WA36_9BACT|nr:type IV pilus twitching motility protein PilT [Paucidesulfovibrio gracilis]SKA74146.1 twitching motility protein PilT [Paucidesulfovibrio gracilis DSM 16080]